MPRPAATKRVVFGDRDYAATDIVHILRMREQRDYSSIDTFGVVSVTAVTEQAGLMRNLSRHAKMSYFMTQ
jgi:hypothetical protein